MAKRLCIAGSSGAPPPPWASSQAPPQPPSSQQYPSTSRPPMPPHFSQAPQQGAQYPPQQYPPQMYGNFPPGMPRPPGFGQPRPMPPGMYSSDYILSPCRSALQACLCVQDPCIITCIITCTTACLYRPIGQNNITLSSTMQPPAYFK